MKKYSLLILALFMSVSTVFSQSAKETLLNFINQQDYEQAMTLVDKAVQENPEDEETLLMGGDVYFEMDNYDKALNLYKKADKVNRKDKKNLAKIALTHLMMKNHSQAINYYDKALDRTKEGSKDYFNMLLKKSNVYISADSFDLAENTIIRVRSHDDENPQIYLALGNLYFARKFYIQAETNYREVLGLDSTIIEARINLANSLYWMANKEKDIELSNEYFNKCIQEWNKVSQQDPKNAKAWRMQGKIFFHGGKNKNAAIALNKYIQLRPSDIESRWMLGQSLFKIGRCDSARTNLEMVSNKVDSLKDDADLMLAQCFYQEKEYSLAIERYAPLYEKGQLDAKNQRRFGRAYFNSGDTNKTFEIWTKLANEHPEAPGNCKLMYVMTQLLTQKKRRVEAVELADLWLKTQTCDSSKRNKILFLAGNNLLNLDTNGTHEESKRAIDYLSKSLEIDSNYIYAWISLGDAYSKIDSSDKAVEIFSKAIEIASMDTVKNKRQIIASFNKVCGMMYKAKKWSQLQKHAKNWTVIQPNVQWGWLYWALSCHSSKQYDCAIAKYKKVLQINPNSSSAKKSLKQLQEALNKNKK